MKSVNVKVITGSSKSEIINDGEIKVYLQSQPEKGKANKELIKLISKKYNIPKSKIKITKGKYSNKKKIEWT